MGRRKLQLEHQDGENLLPSQRETIPPQVSSDSGLRSLPVEALLAKPLLLLPAEALNPSLKHSDRVGFIQMHDPQARNSRQAYPMTGQPKRIPRSGRRLCLARPTWILRAAPTVMIGWLIAAENAPGIRHPCWTLADITPLPEGLRLMKAGQ